jgi:hypothetical protein
MQPNKTLTSNNTQKGMKQEKQRLTVALTANVTGTLRERLLIINKSAQPRCFGRDKPSSYVDWHSNASAWMTREVGLAHAYKMLPYRQQPAAKSTAPCCLGQLHAMRYCDIDSPHLLPCHRSLRSTSPTWASAASS